MFSNIINFNSIKAKKVKNQLIKCYKIMQLELNKQLLNIVYDDNYNDKQRQIDAKISKDKKKTFVKIIISNDCVEYFLHEDRFSDSETYRKFNSVKEFIIYMTDAAVSSYALIYCVKESKEKNIDLKTVSTNEYIDFMKSCRESAEKIFLDRRNIFLESKGFKEIIIK